jgi:hypothetical protein
MALQRLKDEMKTEFINEDGKMKKVTANNVFKFVNEWIENEQANYKKNKDSGLITFGKYKGQSVEQVVQLDKGIDYLGWVSRQSWFNSEKFPTLHAKVTEALNTTGADEKKE